MNKVILMGRLTRDPNVHYANGEHATAVVRFTLAVDRRFARKDSDQQTVDFIGCVSFGRTAEFIEKYFRQGMRVVICGRIQTGSYTNKDGNKVYTVDVVTEEVEFAESKAQFESQGTKPGQAESGFVSPSDWEDEDVNGLPFH